MISGQNRLFLGVGHSALGRPWRDRLDTAGLAQAEALAQVEGIPDTLARIMAGRGVAANEAQLYLEPKLRDLLPDPSVLRDMDRAAARLAQAAISGEKVAIFGDYDVDGACSAALLAGFLAEAGAKPRIHIPDRLIEGYGPNAEAIAMLAGEGATLLVTVDCGTTSHEPLQQAVRLGLDIVVLDHHQAPELLPSVEALVNPNRQDDLAGLGHLCAAGVVFLTLVATNRELRRRGAWRAKGNEPDLLAALDLVALATVADVVPLIGLNRAFVRQGIAMMRTRQRLGLAALLDIAGLDGPVQPWHLGFLLGPRINAGGRIGDAALGARLLLTRDEVEARTIAAELNRLNQERQEIERAAVEEAVAEVEHRFEDAASHPVLLVSSADWHPGIVGLIAGRLKERFRRPAFALARNGDGGATGSGRSIAGVDLGSAVRQAVEAGLAVKGGGHAMAAGVTLAPGQEGAFANFVSERLASGVASSREAEALLIDAAISAGGANPRLLAEIDQAGPFGAGCPEPVFVLPAHRLTEVIEVGAGGHLRIKLRSGDGATIGGIAFRAAREPLGQALLAARGESVHLAGTLTLNRWGGSERAELRVVDLARPA
ncbi:MULTISPECIES: single-stranded-DNA-specific exonuclease RecJ [unclassified Bosea (in: a-proteobacteria)]|uniref:single-stranded-DNA-specific exonuclease RecJ n=1 Tax=unclassified Bosea (in: a-proteobacteria) TaxID=2653178 RepID=UPI000F75F7EB|nr:MULTISPECIES: single-stranded-DNA-specific exonuclease RecJ [unclassified Bosea (in: a-proteobacteria)]AZO81245.1 single-stranded-DNA-specific exonuclease RecJ [Bosea sp. Tri-49]RXT22392.1 single-stranded-DNA-specific exonuclease RecJ [Bosea sp. Tri-39]RXT33220.1 single-stranded-DNA-specific exonuclease RecJ [Bosea sp. Tri-54]